MSCKLSAVTMQCWHWLAASSCDILKFIAAAQGLNERKLVEERANFDRVEDKKNNCVKSKYTG